MAHNADSFATRGKGQMMIIDERNYATWP